MTVFLQLLNLPSRTYNYSLAQGSETPKLSIFPKAATGEAATLGLLEGPTDPDAPDLPRSKELSAAAV